jgi:rubredoxin
MNMMLIQNLLFYVNNLLYASLLFVLLIILLTIFIVLRRAPLPFGEEKSWWQWINTPDPNVQTTKKHEPEHVLEQQVESWLCPVCGSKLSKQDVYQLEIGYDIEWRYCGATISTLRGKY